MSSVALADNDKPIQVGQLPTKAQTFLTTYFKSHKVALAKQESDLFYKTYDVIFTNGEKVEFDKSGEWTEVKCSQSEVPSKIVPQYKHLSYSFRSGTADRKPMHALSEFVTDIQPA